MNTSNIKAGIRARTIILEEGSVDGPSSINPPILSGGDLVAPNGSVYSLDINDDGSLITNKK